MARTVVLAVAVLAAVSQLAGARSAAGATCARRVTGGTPAERAAVNRILCLMPGTAIRRVGLVDASPDGLYVAIVVDPFAPAWADVLGDSRAQWEAAVAAGAIRDGFDRLGLARVVAAEVLSGPEQFDPERLRPLARPEWNLPQWSAGAIPASLGRRVGTWAQLQARLDALSQRFHVRTRLERYNPFGKAPVVTVTTARGGAFIDAGGFQAYERALRWTEARYDGVLLQLVTPSGDALQVDRVDRAWRSSGCSRTGVIPHRKYEICPSD